MRSSTDNAPRARSERASGRQGQASKAQSCRPLCFRRSQQRLAATGRAGDSRRTASPTSPASLKRAINGQPHDPGRANVGKCWSRCPAMSKPRLAPVAIGLGHGFAPLGEAMPSPRLHQSPSSPKNPTIYKYSLVQDLYAHRYSTKGT
jgi:hypothetical protein